MDLNSARKKLQSRIRELDPGVVFSKKHPKEYIDLLGENLDKLLIQDKSFPPDMGFETIPHLIAVGELVEYYLDNSDFLTQLSLTYGNPSKDILRRLIGTGAYLHDIGKNAVDVEILAKRANLTEDELRKFNEHVPATERIMKEMGLAPQIINVGKYHHERINGQGLPNKLRGDEIPLEALAVGCFDVLAGILMKKYYNSNSDIKGPEQVSEYFKQTVGHKFPDYMVDFAVEHSGNGNGLMTIFSKLYNGTRGKKSLIDGKEKLFLNPSDSREENYQNERTLWFL